jgi:chromosome segregation and condensation protein ScpB
MNQQLSSAAQLEAYLFYEGGEAKKSAVTKTLSWTREQLNQAIADLTTVLTDRGITLVHTEDTVALKTAPACAPVIDMLEKDLRERDLGTAGLEVLSLLVYRGASSKSEIDFIRGVNSASTIRHLELRGLVERTKREGERSLVYKTTTDTLGLLGVHDASELPEYESLRSRIAEFEKAEAAPDIPPTDHE